MAIHIALVALSAELAHWALADLAEQNREQVAKLCRAEGWCRLRDGTTIWAVTSADRAMGRYFDQVILADDHRGQVIKHQLPILAQLSRRCQGSAVPPEFRWQLYDLDDGR